MSERKCALWYWQHGGLYVDLCDTEEDAVYEALGMEDAGTGSVAGVQYDDGSYVAYGAWHARKAESDRRYEAMLTEIAEQKQRPKPEVRTVVPPFDAHGATTTVRADAPGWLGVQP